MRSSSRPRPGASFLDAATNTFNTILLQTAGNSSGYSYYDTSDKLVVDSNPAVRQAYDTTMDIIDSGLSGKYGSWSEEWVSAFKQSKFATIACPAWMTGVIEANAGTGAKGKWDIARVPGNGGNWGGSHLAVPKQSKHQAEAIELAKFLTSAKGQIGAFKAKGPLPSSPQALDDPAITGATNAYFSGAPGRRDLRHRREEPEAGLHGPEEPGRTDRGGERRPDRRAGSAQPRAGLDRRGDQREEGRRQVARAAACGRAPATGGPARTTERSSRA